VPRGYNTRSIQDVTPKVKTKTKKGEMPKMQEISGVQERKMIRTD
jgi:ribosomal protein S30